MASKLRLATSIVGAAMALSSFLYEAEGDKLEAYWDTGHVATVCVGHTSSVEWGKLYTEAECKDILKVDVERALAAVDRNTKVELSEGEWVAYGSFVYNLGEPKFKSSTLLKKLNRGDHVGACNELPRWDKGMYKGKLQPIPGLTKRRAAEREICLKG